MDLARCGRIGSLQDGLITRDQALKVLASNQIQRALATGIWERIHESVYRIEGTPRTWRQRVRAATLTEAGNKSIAAYRTAARLYGLIEWQPGEIETLTKVGLSPRTPGVRVHRTRNWHANIATIHLGIRLTTVARTLIDLTAVVSLKVLAKAVDIALTTGQVTLADIATELRTIGTRGRRRCRMLYEVLSHRPEIAALTKSLSEVTVLGWVSDAGLPLPVPQYPIVLSPTWTVFPDLAYPDRMLAIELQSWRWHGGPSKFEDDIRRKNALQRLGWSIIEFSAKTPQYEVIAVLKRALAT